MRGDDPPTRSMPPPVISPTVYTPSPHPRLAVPASGLDDRGTKAASFQVNLGSLPLGHTKPSGEAYSNGIRSEAECCELTKTQSASQKKDLTSTFKKGNFPGACRKAMHIPPKPGRRTPQPHQQIPNPTTEAEASSQSACLRRQLAMASGGERRRGEV